MRPTARRLRRVDRWLVRNLTLVDCYLGRGRYGAAAPTLQPPATRSRRMAFDQVLDSAQAARHLAHVTDSTRETPDAALPPNLLQAEENTPIEASSPTSTPFRGAVAGLTAVTSSLRYAASRSGLIRGVKSLLKVNQKDGFDCPGCAWPDPEHRSMVEFCENGARAVADEAMLATVNAEFFARHSVRSLSEQSDYWLNRQGRIAQPMFLRAGQSHYEPVTWDDAFDLLANALGACESPHRAVFYTSGRTSNEAAFLYQLLVRAYGTNNLPDCSNMCHESSGVGLSETVGIGKGTVSLADFEKTELILVVGQNPGTNHPRMLSALRDAKVRGAKIIAINPLKEASLQRFKHPQKPGDILGSGVEIADIFLQLKINSDVALFKGFAKYLFEQAKTRPELIDEAFIAEQSDGYEEYRADILATSWQDIVAQTGLSQAEIETAAKLYADSKSAIACWAMGLTQHENAVANIQSLVNLMLLRGNIGREGAGLCPVRGHSNVQGDRTMGIWEKPKPEFLTRLGEEFGFDAPTEHGYDVVEAIRAMVRGDVDVFLAMGGNFLSATPDTAQTAIGLRKCKLTVHISTKLNRSHLITGETALILPCRGRTELDVQKSGAQFVTVENSMGNVHMSRGNLSPASDQLRSEVDIVAEIGQRLLAERGRPINWRELADNYDLIRDKIERVIPGFEKFNQRVRTPGGFLLPNGARDRQFATATKKARFTLHPLPNLERAEGTLVMMTIRTHDQYNTTVYDLDDRYRGIHGHRRVILLHPEDMHERGLQPMSKVTITSHFRGEQRHATDFIALQYDIPRGCAATYFPEANVLVPLDQQAHKSHTPASKSVVITVEAQV